MSENTKTSAPIVQQNGGKTLEAGHYRTIVSEMQEYLEEQQYSLVEMVKSKAFDDAYALSQKICETEFWIETFDDRRVLGEFGEV